MVVIVALFAAFIAALVRAVVIVVTGPAAFVAFLQGALVLGMALFAAALAGAGCKAGGPRPVMVTKYGGKFRFAPRQRRAHLRLRRLRHSLFFPMVKM